VAPRIPHATPLSDTQRRSHLLGRGCWRTPSFGLAGPIHGTYQPNQAQRESATHIKVDGARFAHFKVLWDQINRDPRMHFELDTPAQISLVLQRIEEHFSVLPLTVSVTHPQGVHKPDEHHRVESTLGYYQVCSQRGFARRFCSGLVRPNPLVNAHRDRNFVPHVASQVFANLQKSVTKLHL
jgi:hypothetical protein